MMSSEDRHTPRAEFIAALEQDLLRAHRALAPQALSLTRSAAREPAAPRHPRAWGRRARGAALLAIGLVLGVGTQIASAQVQGAKERSEYERERRTERELAAMRLKLAREAATKAQQDYAAGAISRQALLTAETEVKVSELAILKLELELEEIRSTSRAPRDELWAPKVQGRDFVRERLQVEAAAAQERMKSAEDRAKVAEERRAVGAEVETELVQTQRDLLEARREFELQAMKMRLREEAVAKELPSEEVVKRSRRIEAEAAVRRARQRLEMASRRLETVKQRVKGGMAVLLDEKRAELEVLESQAELEAASRTLAALPRPEE